MVWGGMEGAGRWPCSAQHGGDERAAACAASARFSSQAAKVPRFPGMLHQGFVAALYFTLSFSISSFLMELLVGPSLKQPEDWNVSLSPTLTPKSSHISNKKHSIATRIFLRNP